MFFEYNTGASIDNEELRGKVMEPENEIKKRFLILAINILLILFAIFSTFNPDKACASDNREYRPSYTWAEELGSNLATVSEIQERAIGDFGQWISRKYGAIPDLPRALIEDIPGVSQTKTILYDAPRISRIEDDTQRVLDGTVSGTSLFIPFSNTMRWRIDQALERSQHIIEDRIQQENLNSAFYQEQYQSAQFGIQDPIVTALETQIVNFESQQMTMDYLRSMEVGLEAGLEAIQPTSFDDYRDVIHNMELDQQKYIQSLSSDHTTMDYIHPTQPILDTFQASSFYDYTQLNLDSHDTIYHLESLQAPDWGQLQNMSTMDTQQFNDYLDTTHMMESQHLIDLTNLRNIEIPTIINHLEPIRIEPIFIEPIRITDY